MTEKPYIICGPVRSGLLSTRRLKRSPLQDVASMLRSLRLAAYRGLQRHVERGGIAPEISAELQPWAHYCGLWAGSAFLRAYLRTAAPGDFLPAQRADLGGLLFVYRLAESLQDLGIELQRDPADARLPLQSLVRLQKTES